jgi:TPR repeat protein
LNFERLAHAVALVLLAATASGCATGAREAAQLRTTVVDCRIAEDASAAVPRSVRLSARDCADAGGDYPSADTLADFKLWLPLAKDGDAAAQTRIGMHYEQGVAGIAADHNTAAVWYRKAVHQEHAPAMLRLAVLLEQGLGLRADPDAARALLRRACTWWSRRCC